MGESREKSGEIVDQMSWETEEKHRNTDGGLRNKGKERLSVGN